MKSQTKQRTSLGALNRSPKSATSTTTAAKKGKKKKQTAVAKVIQLDASPKRQKLATPNAEELKVDKNAKKASEDESVQIGSWDKSATAKDIEAYLLVSQRKFAKYRLNIFYLNKCALKLQHSFKKWKQGKQGKQKRLATKQFSQQQSMSNHKRERSQQSPIGTATNISSIAEIEGQLISPRSLNSIVTTTYTARQMEEQYDSKNSAQNMKSSQLQEEIYRQTPKFRTNNVVEDHQAKQQLAHADKGETEVRLSMGQRKASKKKIRKPVSKVESAVNELEEIKENSKIELVGNKTQKRQRSPLRKSVMTSSPRRRSNVSPQRQRTTVSKNTTEKGGTTTTTTVTSTISYNTKGGANQQTMKSSKSSERFTRLSTGGGPSASKPKTKVTTKKVATVKRSAAKETSKDKAPSFVAETSNWQNSHSEVQQERQIEDEVIEVVETKKQKNSMALALEKKLMAKVLAEEDQESQAIEPQLLDEQSIEYQHQAEQRTEYQHQADQDAEYQHQVDQRAEYQHQADQDAEYQHQADQDAEYQHLADQRAEYLHQVDQHAEMEQVQSLERNHESSQHQRHDGEIDDDNLDGDDGDDLNDGKFGAYLKNGNENEYDNEGDYVNEDVQNDDDKYVDEGKDGVYDNSDDDDYNDIQCDADSKAIVHRQDESSGQGEEESSILVLQKKENQEVNRQKMDSQSMQQAPQSIHERSSFVNENHSMVSETRDQVNVSGLIQQDHVEVQHEEKYQELSAAEEELQEISYDKERTEASHVDELQEYVEEQPQVYLVEEQHQEISPIKQHKEASPVKKHQASPVKKHQASPVKKYQASPVKKHQASPIKRQREVSPVKQHQEISQAQDNPEVLHVEEYQAISNSSIVKNAAVHNDVSAVVIEQESEVKQMSTTMQSKQLRQHMFDDTLHQSQFSEETAGYESKTAETGTTKITRSDRKTKQQRLEAKLQKQKEVDLLVVKEQQKQIQDMRAEDEYGNDGSHSEAINLTVNVEAANKMVIKPSQPHSQRNMSMVDKSLNVQLDQVAETPDLPSTTPKIMMDQASYKTTTQVVPGTVSGMISDKRSVSQLSVRSTLSSQQKNVQACRQSNVSLLATQSLPKFQQERTSRQDRIHARTIDLKVEEKPARKTTTEWKSLRQQNIVTPDSQNTMSQLTEEERRALRERQASAINRLTMQTVASRAKSRIRSKSAKGGAQGEKTNDNEKERSEEEVGKAAASANMMTMSNHSTSQKSKLTDIQRKNKVRADIQFYKDLAARKLAQRTLEPSATQKNFTTTKHDLKWNQPQLLTRNISSKQRLSFKAASNGKEQRQRSYLEKAQPEMITPRATQQSQVAGRKMMGVATREVSLPRGVPAIDLKSMEKKSTMQVECAPVAQEDSIIDAIHQMSGTGAAHTPNAQKVAVDLQSQEDQKFTPVVTDNQKELIPAHSPMQTLKSSSQSFNATASAGRLRQMSTKLIAPKDTIELQEDAFSSTQKNMQLTIQGRGMPLASEARAAKRRIKDQEQSDVSQSETQFDEPRRQSAKSSSMHSFATAGSKSVALRQNRRHQQRQNDEAGGGRRDSLLTNPMPTSIHLQPQQVQSETKKKAHKSQIGTEKFTMSEQQKSEASESLRDFEREEAKVLLEEGEAVGELRVTKTPKPQSFIENVRVSIKNSSASRSRSPMKSSEIGTGSSKTPQTSMFPREESKVQIAKCFADDISFSKIEKSFRRDYRQINTVLSTHYLHLVAIFTFYAGMSKTYPAIAYDDFMMFCRETGIVSAQSSVTETAIIKCFTQTIASSANFKTKGEKSLNRYEFLEILVCIAVIINKEPQNKQQSQSETLQILLTTLVLPNAQRTHRTKFWRQLSADSRVMELLNQNSEVILAAFKYFTHERKTRVSLEECTATIRQCQLDISDQLLNICFAESQQMPSSDTSERNKERLFQLSYPEFVYFLCRVTDAHYEDTVYEGEEYWIKLDHMILFLLDPFELCPLFRHGAKFAYDSQQQHSYKQVVSQYLEDEMDSEFKEVDPATTQSPSKKVESTRYSQVAEDMQEVAEHMEASSMVVDTLNEVDIQAWPQPSPIAYPQSIPVTTQDNMEDHSKDSSSLIDTSQIRQVHQKKSFAAAQLITQQPVTVVEERSSNYRVVTVSSGKKVASNTSATKMRSYVKTTMPKKQTGEMRQQ